MARNTGPELDPFVRAYLHALAFTEDPHPPQGEYPEPDYRREFGRDLIARAVRECAEFETRARAILAELGIDPDTMDWDHAARDFWYTRNGHGCGFWDGDWDEPLATRLTDLAHGYGEVAVDRYRGRFV